MYRVFRTNALALAACNTGRRFECDTAAVRIIIRVESTGRTEIHAQAMILAVALDFHR